MINKGGHTIEVLKTLNNILSRSRKNNFKNRRLFRELSIAHNFIADGHHHLNKTEPVHVL